MKKDLSAFQAAIEKAVEELFKVKLKESLIVHHDEADGICSAAIIKRALERENFAVKTICLDKFFPEVMKNLQALEGKLLFYTDIGSAHVKKVSDWNSSRNIIIILDHHDTEASPDPKVHNINPELYGISGEREASSSTVAYSFAKALNQQNQDLAHLAIIGSAEIPGPLIGLNENALHDATEKNIVQRIKTRSMEDVKILALGKPLSYHRYSTLLSVLGSVGYYKNGPDIGVKACLEGWDVNVEKKAGELEEVRKKANRKLVEKLKGEGLKQLKNIQWFHAEDNFEGMSGKVIGSFCSYISYQRMVNPVKYIIGLMNMSRLIPGYGKLEKDYVKVSGRAPKILTKMMEEGKKPSLSKVLTEACEAYSGFADGHSVAASGIFVKGSEDGFIDTLDRLGIYLALKKSS